MLSSFNLKLLSVSISLEKNFISGPYNKVSSLFTPGIILSRVSNPSKILVIIRWGSTKARSPATQSFKVGSTKPLLIRCHSLLLAFLKSLRDWIIGFPSPNTLAIRAIDSPYDLVLVTGWVKFTLDIKAKLELLLLISFRACPLTHINP